MKRFCKLFVLTALVLTACGGSSKSEGNPNRNLPPDSLVVAYDDDKFSLLLPQGWVWDTDTCETWQIKHIVDSLKISSGIVEFIHPKNSFKIRLVKGATRWLASNNPVTDWAALSQMMANQDPSCILIGNIVDSISVDGNDACRFLSTYDLDGDTIVQDQYVVIKDKYGLYYLNGIYDYHDNESKRLFDKIVSTIKLK